MSHSLTILKIVLMILQNNMYGYRSEMEHLYSIMYFTVRLISLDKRYKLCSLQLLGRTDLTVFVKRSRGVNIYIPAKIFAISFSQVLLKF